MHQDWRHHARHFGPLSMFLVAGFEIVNERDNGEVLVRKSLVSGS